MRKRVEETLDLLGHRRAARRAAARPVRRPAAAGRRSAPCSPRHPRVLVLDEPTSALDPTAAEEVLAASPGWCTTSASPCWWPSTGSSGSCSTPTASCTLPGDGTVRDGPPADVLADSPAGAAGRRARPAAGWDPLPLSVRDARRLAAPLRDDLPLAPPTSPARVPAAPARPPSTREPAESSCATATSWPSREVDLDLRPGEVIALMGRNGSGKSSLLWALQGTGTRTAARVRVGPATAPTRAQLDARRGRARWSAWCRRRAADLLYLDTVAAECAQADRESRRGPGHHARRCSSGLLPGIDRDAPPARPVRGPAARARAGRPAGRRARRAAARRAHPRARLRRQGARSRRAVRATSPPRAAASCWRPTTSSSSPTPPTGWW